MGRVAFLFAGQGAQVPGMAGDVKDLPKVKKLFDLAESIQPGVVDKMLSGTRSALRAFCPKRTRSAPLSGARS